MSTASYTAPIFAEPDLSHPDTVVCRCLGVTVAEIKTAASLIEKPTAGCVMSLTGAGGGCTACHRRIRGLMANQCPPSSSPIICAR